MDPMTAMIVASAIAAAAKGTGDVLSNAKSEKMAKRRAKETERETQAGMLQDSLARSAELESHRLAGRQKLGKRKASSLQDTADIVRGALKI